MRREPLSEMEDHFDYVNIIVPNYLLLIIFTLYSFKPNQTKNAYLTQFEKQRGQRFHLKWDRSYSCHLHLGHRHLIFKCYSL